MSKIGRLLINNNFSVEQAISYFILTGVSEQVLLLALIIYYLSRLKTFFTACAIAFFNTIVIGLKINFRLSCFCFITHLFQRYLVVFQVFL